MEYRELGDRVSRSEKNRRQGNQSGEPQYCEPCSREKGVEGDMGESEENTGDEKNSSRYPQATRTHRAENHAGRPAKLHAGIKGLQQSRPLGCEGGCTGAIQRFTQSFYRLLEKSSSSFCCDHLSISGFVRASEIDFRGVTSL